MQTTGTTGRAVAARLGMIGLEPVRFLDAAHPDALSEEDLRALLRPKSRWPSACFRPQEKIRVVRVFQGKGTSFSGAGVGDERAVSRPT
ncbi:MAG: hypothetical protein ACREQM_05290 [Candidatus Dormibacteraceae bacterium]